MSAEATGWVYRHSPYRGALFQIHHAIADSVNDQYGNELWMALGRLAAKARVGRKTATDAIAQMVSDGFLTVIEDHRFDRAGKPSRFLFMFPPVDVAYETRQGVGTQNAPPLAKGASSVPGGVRTEYQGGAFPGRTIPREPKQLTQAVESSPSPSAPRPTDDPVKRHAHTLAVLAFEQPVKPALRSGGNAFSACMKLIEEVVRSGVPVKRIEAAIRSGVEVWTLAGLQTAIARAPGGSRPGGPGPRLVDDDERRSRPAGRIAL